MFLAIPTVATKPPVHHAAHGARRCRRDDKVRSHPTPRASESTQPPLTRWMYASRAIADKEAVEARQIQLALREAFDEIDDDALRNLHLPSSANVHDAMCISTAATDYTMRGRFLKIGIQSPSVARQKQPTAPPDAYTHISIYSCNPILVY